MLNRRTRQKVRRHAGAQRRCELQVARSSQVDRSEFRDVNALAGIEAIRPELSGLALQPPALPGRVTHLMIQLAYAWSPSREHQRRAWQMRLMNQRLRHKPAPLELLPPILGYLQRADIAAARFQPVLDRHGDVWELTDLEERERSRRPPMIRPRVAGLDQEYLTGDRPLFPRRYGRFLRSSPYPRLAAGAAAAALAVAGFLWASHLRQGEAVAAGQARVVRLAPRSLDVPPAAARHIYDWTSWRTEAVVF